MICHQEELDKDINDNSRMQLYNLQNSFKASMIRPDDTIRAILSRKMPASKKQPTDMSKSNFMSKISKLDSGFGSSLGTSRLSSRLSTQSKQRLVALKSHDRQA